MRARERLTAARDSKVSPTTTSGSRAIALPEELSGDSRLAPTNRSNIGCNCASRVPLSESYLVSGWLLRCPRAVPAAAVVFQGLPFVSLPQSSSGCYAAKSHLYWDASNPSETETWRRSRTSALCSQEGAGSLPVPPPIGRSETMFER